MTQLLTGDSRMLSLVVSYDTHQSHTLYSY